MMLDSIWAEIKNNFLRGNDIIVQLIVINVAIFLIESIFFVLFFLFTGDRSIVTNFVHEWFALPSNISRLLFRPWTFLTYMFLHAGILHLLFNMLILYWFGRIFQQMLGSRKVLPVFIVGGLIGGFFYILAYNLFPAFEMMAELGVPLLGASAGVMAIVVAAAYIAPNFSLYLLFFGPVKIKYIALFFVCLDLFYGIASNNAGGSFAHLGGALYGFLFARQLKEGNDWSRGFNKIFDWFSSIFSPSSNIKVEYKNQGRRQQPPRHHATEEAEKQKRIDAILDKIAQSGYDSLSAEEKEFLFKASKED